MRNLHFIYFIALNLLL